MAKYMFWCSHNDIEKTKNWVRKEQDKVNDPNWYRFAIVLREGIQCRLYLD